MLSMLWYAAAFTLLRIHHPLHFAFQVHHESAHADDGHGGGTCNAESANQLAVSW